ncbi:hypothetical protein ACFLU6_04115 [Acidobacteriota bacterium]
MRRSRNFLLVSIVAGALMLCTFISAAMAGPGNGAPKGAHFNLNIIGVSKDKTADMDGNSGHRIFVKLQGNSKIWLTEGDDFLVLDANGTDSDGAEFQLPDPDPDDDLVLEYSVYARPLGKPGGQARMTTCYIDDLGDEICSMESLTLKRSKGKQRFENVSKELLTIIVDTDGDGLPDTRMGIFDEDTYEYLWEYDNNGLKLLQLRFYPIVTDAN